MRTGPSSPSLRASPIGRLRTTDPLPVFRGSLLSFPPAPVHAMDRFVGGRDVNASLAIFLPLLLSWDPGGACCFQSGRVRVVLQTTSSCPKSGSFEHLHPSSDGTDVAGGGAQHRMDASKRHPGGCSSRGRDGWSAFVGPGANASILRPWMGEESRRLVVLQEDVVTPVVPRPQGRPDPRPSIGPIVGDPSPIDRIGSPMEKGGLIGGILVDRGRVRRIDLGSPDGNSAVQRRPCWRKTNEPRTRTRPSRRFLPRLGLDGNIRVAGRTGGSTKAGYATYARKPCGRNRPDVSRPWTVHAWTFRSGSGAWSGPSGSRREATSRPWCRVRAERSVSERSFQSLGTVCRLVTRIRRVVAPVDDPGTDAVIFGMLDASVAAVSPTFAFLRSCGRWKSGGLSLGFTRPPSSVSRCVDARPLFSSLRCLPWTKEKGGTCVWMVNRASTWTRTPHVRCRWGRMGGGERRPVRPRLSFPVVVSPSDTPRCHPGCHRCSESCWTVRGDRKEGFLHRPMKRIRWIVIRGTTPCLRPHRSDGRSETGNPPDRRGILILCDSCPLRRPSFGVRSVHSLASRARIDGDTSFGSIGAIGVLAPTTSPHLAPHRTVFLPRPHRTFPEASVLPSQGPQSPEGVPGKGNLLRFRSEASLPFERGGGSRSKVRSRWWTCAIPFAPSTKHVPRAALERGKRTRLARPWVVWEHGGRQEDLGKVPFRTRLAARGRDGGGEAGGCGRRRARGRGSESRGNGSR
eukprot:scaffold840_cov344-Pavlova_lutheri.AAC.98